MANKRKPAASRPVSVRLNPEEFAHLESLELPGARTAGQKLRALLASARELSPGAGDYPAQLARMQAQVQPIIQAAREAEHDMGLRSELVPRVADSLAEAVAWLLTQAAWEDTPDREALDRLEAGLADRSAALARHLFEVYLSGDSAAYDRSALADRVAPVAALALLDPGQTKSAEKTGKKNKNKNKKGRKKGK
jgi:hypothetical protein